VESEITVKVNGGSLRNPTHYTGTCHGSLGRSNRVTFCPKKESLSKKKFSAAWRMPITKLIPSPNPHLLPHLDGHATTPLYKCTRGHEPKHGST